MGDVRGHPPLRSPAPANRFNYEIKTFGNANENTKTTLRHSRRSHHATCNIGGAPLDRPSDIGHVHGKMMQAPRTQHAQDTRMNKSHADMSTLISHTKSTRLRRLNAGP